MEMDIDGVGGVSILAKAKVFRSGVHFPAFSFEKHAETEGFGKVRSWKQRLLDNAKFDPDGKAYAIFRGWLTALHYMAFVRAQCGWYSTHGGGSIIAKWLYIADMIKEMEQERIARENEEKERAERMKKIKDQFADPNSQWEKDKNDIQNEAMKEKKEKEQAEAKAAEASKAAEATKAAESNTDSKKESKEDSSPASKAETKAESKTDSKAEGKDAQGKAQ